MVTITNSNASIFLPNPATFTGKVSKPQFVVEMLKQPEVPTDDAKYEAMREEIKNLPLEPWMLTLDLATPVLFSTHLVRQQILRKATFGKNTWKIWQRTAAGGLLSGFIMGARTLADGVLDYDSDYGHSFCGRHHFMGYTVVTGLRSKPYLVLPQDIILPGQDLDPL